MKKSIWLNIILGVFLIVAFFLSSESFVGTSISFLPPWNNMTAGELHFWFNAIIFLLPGCLLLVGSLLSCFWDPFKKGVLSLEGQSVKLFCLFVFSIAFIGSVLGRYVFLLDWPITDDEFAARHGAQILLNGSWRAPIPQAWDSFPHIFLYVHQPTNTYTSFDWPGAILAWVVALGTGLDSTLFALAAALTAVAVFVGVDFAAGRRQAFIASLLYLSSPMALSLSWATHAHVMSRCALACAIAATFWARREGSRSYAWLLVGAFAGLAFLVRPLESLALLAPLLVLQFVESHKEPSRRKILFVLLGAAPSLLLFVYSNIQITGIWWMPARIANLQSGLSAHNKAPLAFLNDFNVLKSRVVNNVIYNLSMLCLWAVSPIGLLLTWFGVSRHRYAVALFVGIIADLGLGLLHDDYGLHIVGPIHYSEAIIPFVYLAALGFDNIFKVFEQENREGSPLHLILKPWLIGLIGAICLSNYIFAIHHGAALRKQASIHEHIYNLFESDASYNNSVILAPHYGLVWGNVPSFASTGSFVFEWRPVSPGRTEPVIFLNYVPEQVPQLLQHFPDRRFFVMTPLTNPPYFTAVPLK